MGRFLLAVLIAAALLRAAPASAACLTLGADERLTARCLFDRFLNATPTGKAAIDPVLNGIFARQGRTPGSVGRVDVTPFVQPVLSWSNDINGGNPDRPLDLGFIVLNPLPPFRKSGVLAGARAGATGRIVYRRGGFADFTLHGTAEYAPAHDIGVLGYFGRLCSRNEAGLRWTADACLTASGVERDLSRDRALLAEVSLGRMFALGGNRHQLVQGGARRLETLDYVQWQYFAAVQSISARHPFVAVEVGMGEPVADQTVTLHSLRATVSDRVMGRPFSLTARYGFAAGERLFGVERRERELSLVAAVDIWRGWYLRAGYRDVDSNIDYFDESEPIIGLSVPGLRF